MGDIEPELLRSRVVRKIAAVPAADWDRAAGNANPFVSHRFLTALEDSGCASPRTGWAPWHVVLEDESGALAAAAPAYMKTHSMGEYVFDQGWAEAYEQTGGKYYPKLQVAVPFTPVPGPRLLIAPGVDPARTRGALARALTAEGEQLGVSSVHATFCTEEEWRALAAEGWLQRTGEQFHWSNNGYVTFDDFLGELASRKRKGVRKEREQALADGAISVRVLEGGEVTDSDWDAFFAFYTDTGNRKWGRPYLNRKFFALLGQRMADAVVLVMAYRDGTPIAGALNLRGPDALFGRYWGCTEYQPALHFEVCYYQAIAYAIDHGLARVEAGAQGPHKLARGYLPVRTYSAHWIADPVFRRRIAAHLVQERQRIEEDIAALAEFAPFRHDPGDMEAE